jgi:rare lipoprotein A
MSKSFKLVLFAIISTSACQAFASIDSGEIMATQTQEQVAVANTDANDDLIVEVLPAKFELNSQEQAFLDGNGYLPVEYSNPEQFASNGKIHRKRGVHHARVRRHAASEQVATGTGRSFSGKASFYSDSTKACRQRNNGMTVAHRSLPCGTMLRVTYHGKSVLAMVNDRGPFVRGRVLDLNTPVARAIGLTGAGVGTVQAEVLN